MLKYLFILGFFILVFLLIRRLWKRNSWVFPDTDFPVKWKKILTEKISFYNALKQEEKKDFEYKIQEFLLNCKITGIKTEVDLTDKILVAASAIIPIFPFKDWRYLNLQEVLLYPGRFAHDFAVEGDKRNILGMVGYGSMEGKMILSKRSLQKGFSIATDKKNTAIHEFVHLIDKMDGSTDGIPELLVDKQFSIPWMKLIQEKTQEILDNQSDINPYASTSPTEFLAVVSEYFFERPKLLAEKHPKLYAILEQIFKQKMKKRKLHFKKFKTGRNSPCPCGSGMKFKHCCGKKD
jgi:Mlc titration factor MtfA (ptsG expression regulator)